MKYYLIRILAFSSIFTFSFVQGEELPYNFFGRHFVASYVNCDKKALVDLENLEKTMIEATRACGATILSSNKHIFLPDGFTMIVLLSESHASIHTYPEHDSCFVDLFTCGYSCDASIFDAVLSDYLKPKQVDKQMLSRNHLTTVESNE